SPQMDAWSGAPVPENLVAAATPRELMGAAVFQNKSCRDCHALEGSGGQRGPDLAGVGARLTRDQLIDQVSNGTPGGGNMPAYGRHVSPAEMSTLTDSPRSPRARAPASAPAAHARPPPLDPALRPWPGDPGILAGLPLPAVVYLRGWWVYRRRDPVRWRPRQPAAFLGGLAALGLALASP